MKTMMPARIVRWGPTGYSTLHFLPESTGNTQVESVSSITLQQYSVSRGRFPLGIHTSTCLRDALDGKSGKSVRHLSKLLLARCGGAPYAVGTVRGRG